MTSSWWRCYPVFTKQLKLVIVFRHSRSLLRRQDHRLVIWCYHDDVMKWKHFPRYWPFLRGIHRWPVNSLHKDQWRGALMCSLICAWINGLANNREADDLRRCRALWRHCNRIFFRISLFGLSENRFFPRPNFIMRYVTKLRTDAWRYVIYLWYSKYEHQGYCKYSPKICRVSIQHYTV